MIRGSLYAYEETLFILYISCESYAGHRKKNEAEDNHTKCAGKQDLAAHLCFVINESHQRVFRLLKAVSCVEARRRAVVLIRFGYLTPFLWQGKKITP